ncbi:MAG TPA: UDP-2,3-diacylglucosamine diphosphatase [Candidatus Competibacteraceae bacterium]|nr:UDP-2,3-diacylglucosamine diphosphatase [Candidatus Competibacteraceae bacterium]
MSRPILFISDLHLDPARPAVTALFLQFLERCAARAEALYILGDLFEAWLGDDDDGEPGATVAAALRRLAEGGVAVYFCQGNRDFLLGAAYAARCGMTLLAEETVIELHGVPTLVTHGDQLCTDDVEYQRFRAQARSSAWQTQVLALPLPQRRAMARQLREFSQAANQQKAEYIMDVNATAVAAALRHHDVSRLIHGHTHRPAIHDLSLDGRPAQRIVLGDWYEQGSVLVCAPGAIPRLENLPLQVA